MGKDAQSMILALQNWSARDSRVLRITLWCQSQCQTKPNLFRDASLSGYNKCWSYTSNWT